MREDRRRRYDDGFRREALELIKAGAGGNTLARRLAIPVYTARNWIRLYRSGGEEAVMGGNGSRRLYMGNTVWCIGLGRSGEDGPYYPQSLRKGNAAKEKMPGTQIHHVVSIKYLNTAQCHPSIQD
ncbi:hypothetical protein MCC01998_17320 [Bifidobacteriaceae bacterium MCC01998]|nr:hypothetical protein MCC02037_01300 [Bifidobacteriaceae bacterium MCC02037]GDZ67263.1 hypothetical protein MCC01988_01300 [Bifidobacteriaceae bacterium MCC01988]GDZ74657.1 hypothetical protein MCC01998_17320 [Bifidobacteriaceae bacterium MCC01998]